MTTMTFLKTRRQDRRCDIEHCFIKLITD